MEPTGIPAGAATGERGVPGDSPGGGAGGPDFRDFLAMLSRHRWSALLVLVLVVATGAIRSLRETPIYRSTPALLEVTSDNTGIATISDVFERQYITQDHIETQIRLIKSATVLRAAYEGPEGRELAGRISYAAFAGGLVVVPVRNSFLVEVSFEGPDPEVNPLAANAAARTYIRVGREQKEARTSNASTQFEKRREGVRAALAKADEAIAAFRKEHQVADLKAEKAGADALKAQADAKYDEKRLEFVAIEQSRGEVQAARAAGRLDRIGSVLKDPAYQALERDLRQAEADLYDWRQKRTEDSEQVKMASERVEDLKRRRAALAESIAGQIEVEYETAQQAVRRVEAICLERSRAQESLSRLLNEQTILEAERDRLLQDLAFLTQQSSQVQGTAGFDLAPAILQEEARRSDDPIRPKHSRDILIALLLGVALATGAAFLLDQFHDAVTRPEEITRVTGLPILGMLPRLTRQEIEAGGVAAMGNTQSEMAEAVRIIRTGILFTPSGAGERRRILVTSAESGEGKTLLSSNLAAAMAQAGQRTLLIDADLRKPKLHRVFGLSNDTGLTGIFAGGREAPAPRSVGVGDTAFDVLPSGPIPPNPAELLGGDRITAFFTRMGEEYQRILVDSPPAGPVSDPALLARQVDGVLLVVRLGKTSVRAIRRACDHLQKVGAPLLGVVLNGVSMGGGYYYYHYYSRYGYAGEDPGADTGGNSAAGEGNP